MDTALVVLLFALTSVLFYAWMRSRREVQVLRLRYAPVLDIDAAVAEARARLEVISREADAARVAAEQQRRELTTQYHAALTRHQSLTSELRILEENLEDISFGLYKPHYDFASSEAYKAALLDVRNRQKAMVREGKAATSARNWEVGGSKTAGKRMTKQYLKVLLRAFNGECDAAIAIVRWDNATKMEERLRKAYEAINKLGAEVEMSIAKSYLDLKLAELRLVHEHERKRQEERDEQRRIRQQIREEERVQRELAQAQEEAERDELRFEKALERARAEAQKATGEELAALNVMITDLQYQLDEAHRQKERALSRAQLTKSGHVYIISNRGAFGERVVKVGMTRRLEPEERIHELGDASVPFPFDLHALIASDDAPRLESELHAFLEPHRINLVNLRKEFFEVDLAELEHFTREKGLQVEFLKTVEAKEYRESVGIRRARTVEAVEPKSGFPSDPFEQG